MGKGSKVAEAYVLIRSEDSALARGMTKMRGDFSATVARMQSTANGLKGTLLGLGAAMGVSFSIGQIIQQTIAHEKAEMKLRSTLMTTGNEITENAKRLSGFAESMQRSTNVNDEFVKELAALGLNLGVPVSAIEDTTKAAIGLAEVMGVDATEAMHMLIKAQQGEFGMISKQLVLLKSMRSDEEKLAYIQKIATAGLRQKAAATNTLGGEVDRLKNATEDLAKSLGHENGLLVTSIQLLTTLSQVLTKNSSAQKEFKLNWINDVVVNQSPAMMLAKHLGLFKDYFDKIDEQTQKQMNDEVNASNASTDLKIKNLKRIAGETKVTFGTLDDIYKNNVERMLSGGAGGGGGAAGGAGLVGSGSSSGARGNYPRSSSILAKTRAQDVLDQLRGSESYGDSARKRSQQRLIDKLSSRADQERWGDEEATRAQKMRARSQRLNKAADAAGASGELDDAASRRESLWKDSKLKIERQDELIELLKSIDRKTGNGLK